MRHGVVLAIAAFLLVSMGGAIVAAPVLVPLLVWAVRTSGHAAYRRAATVVLALTVGEVAWALTYLTGGEAKPAIWLVPALAIGAVVLTAPQWSRRYGDRFA